MAAWLRMRTGMRDRVDCISQHSIAALGSRLSRRRREAKHTPSLESKRHFYKRQMSLVDVSFISLTVCKDTFEMYLVKDFIP